MIYKRYLVQAARTWIGQHHGDEEAVDEAKFIADCAYAYWVAMTELRKKRRPA